MPIGFVDLSTRSSVDSPSLLEFVNSKAPVIIILPRLRADHELLLTQGTRCGFVCTTDSPATIQGRIIAANEDRIGISATLLTGLFNPPERQVIHSLLTQFSKEDVKVLEALRNNQTADAIAKSTNFSTSSVNRRIQKFKRVFDTPSKAELSFCLRHLLPNENQTARSTL